MKNKFIASLLLITGIAFTGCSDSSKSGGEDAASDAKAITSFIFYDADNEALTSDVVATIDGFAISATAPHGTEITALVPTIEITGQTVNPASGDAADFTSAVTYTVTAANSSTQEYTVTVTIAATDAKAITSFIFYNADNEALTSDVAALIDGFAINATAPYGTDVTALVPTIATTGLSVNPASGDAADFTSAVTYTVTAADTTTQEYTITVTTAASEAKAITSFIFYDADNEALTSDVAASIDGFTISATVPYGTNVTALVPTIATTGLSVNPASGASNDFTSDVIYTVIAADATTQEYTVTVTILAASDAKAITSFIFYDSDNVALTSDVAASIDEFAINATAPYGTDVTSLVPIIVTTGLSVNPASGDAANFTDAVTYTVTAEDSSTKEYTVTVGKIFFVDTDAVGNGDGSSWGDAYTHPMDAIDVAELGDEIWVAGGSYTAREGDESVIEMKENVKIYGGFNGTETSVDDRVIDEHETLLEGEGIIVHVVIGANNSTINGFTITGGNAGGNVGGGIYNNRKSPLIENCILINNIARKGGAIYNRSNFSNIIHCTFTGNSAISETSGYGGAVYSECNACGAVISDCTFSSNSADLGGGGVYICEYSPDITDCAFLNNTSGKGGAVYNESGDTLKIEDCIFTENSANGDEGIGGAVYNESMMGVSISYSAFNANTAQNGGGGLFNDGSRIYLNDCQFNGNLATGADSNGGAINNLQATFVSIKKCAFKENNALSSGGGIYNIKESGSAATFKVSGCIFNGNTTSSTGSGIFIEGQLETQVYNCIFTVNLANDTPAGGAIHINGTGTDGWSKITNVTFYNNTNSISGDLCNEMSVFVTNCIVWGNNNAEIFFNTDFIDSFPPIVQYSDVDMKDSNADPHEGIDNINADPLFADALNNDFHLQGASPCIDAACGEPAPFYELDKDGNERFDDPDTEPNTGYGDPDYIDMGAFEYQG